MPLNAMEEMTEIKKLNVYSKIHAKTVSVIVENNGPMIPIILQIRFLINFIPQKETKMAQV